MWNRFGQGIEGSRRNTVETRLNLLHRSWGFGSTLADVSMPPTLGVHLTQSKAADTACLRRLQH